MLGCVGRRPLMPRELLNGPFTLDHARRAGVSRSALRGKQWQRLATGLYSAREAPDDPFEVLSGWLRALPEGTTLAGATAAWLHGLKADPLNPIEVLVGPDRGVRSRPGLYVRRCVIQSGDLETVRGMPATTLHRTLADLCCWRSAVEALVVVDMAVEAGATDAVQIANYANSIRGKAGSVRLRKLAQIAEPAESAMETRLRWLFLRSGLPRPEVQVDIRVSAGAFVARADLYYPSARLIVEFDGANHKDRLISDYRRQNLILNAGYRLLRYTTADLRDRPDVIVAQVRAALAGPASREAQFRAL
jgi:very-short-patch-repair endonuclease